MVSSIISTTPERTSTQISKPFEAHAGTTTSWLSMITSPPIDPRCSSHLFNRGGRSLDLVAFDPRLETAANMTCLPQEAVHWYTRTVVPFGATTGTVTSLGPVICPDAYTTASTSEKDKTSTMVYCCPSNYDFATPADHDMLYGCTSQQTRELTVHFSAYNSTPSTTTVGARLHFKARQVAGVPVNGWIFKSASPSTSATLTPTLNSEAWAMKHLGVTTAAFCSIVIGTSAAIVLFFIALCWFIRRRFFVRPRTAESNKQGIRRPRNSSISEDRIDLNPRGDVELDDLDSSRNRVPSATETVVRRFEHSASKTEGSSATDDNGERTA